MIHIQLGKKKHLQGFGYATKQSGKKIVRKTKPHQFQRNKTRNYSVHKEKC